MINESKMCEYPMKCGRLGKSELVVRHSNTGNHSVSDMKSQAKVKAFERFFIETCLLM